MNFNRLQNVLLILLVMVIAVSIAFCTSLSLMEYLRIFILGSAVALVFAAFPHSFGCSYTRKCVLGAAYAFILYVLDPNTNSSVKFSLIKNPSYGFRLLTGIILFAALIIWLIPLATRTIGIRKWGRQFSRVELYLIAFLVSFGLIAMVLEVLFIHEGTSSFYNSMLRGTKIIDCILVFLLITHALDSESGTENWRYTVLVIALLAFCAFTSLVGGSRAYAAYRSARLTDTTPLKLSGNQNIQEKLLRVFSLNSREAWTVYAAGYAAGRKEWDTAHARLARAGKFRRDSLIEADAMAFLDEGNYNAAIRTLESLPVSYNIQSDISDHLAAITSRIKDGTGSPSLSYLAGLLTLHAGRVDESHFFLDAFLSVVSNHANATYFRYYNDANRLMYFSTLQMPAAGWFYPLSRVKSVLENPGHITVMYNQHIQGALWLVPGTYTVSVLARDDGTLLAGKQESVFDPSCKMRVWVGSTPSRFTVFSTNRQFQSYQLTVAITDEPTAVIIEFTNDIYNQEYGWDRNLSVSRLEFRRKN